MSPLWNKWTHRRKLFRFSELNSNRVMESWNVYEVELTKSYKQLKQFKLSDGATSDYKYDTNVRSR